MQHEHKCLASGQWPTRPARTPVAVSGDMPNSSALISITTTARTTCSPFVFIIALFILTSITSARSSEGVEAVPSMVHNSDNSDNSRDQHNTTTNTSSNTTTNSNSKSNKSLSTTIQQLVLYSHKVNHTIANSTNRHATTIVQNEGYKVNTPDLERVSRMIRDGRMKSACVQAGLWAIFYNPSFQNIAAVLYASSNSNDQTCTQNQINETDFSQYKSIRHVGHSNLLASALSLYKGPFFSLDELYFDGNLLSLPAPESFHSYGFTGNHSWTLYQHNNFTGHAICLMAYGQTGHVEDTMEVTNTFDRVIYNKNKGVEFRIGAIQKGCTDKQNRTVIYPSGETVVEWTNKPLGSDRNLEHIEFRIHNNEVPSLKLISEFDGHILTTDAEELRLSHKYTFNRFIVNAGTATKTHLESSLDQELEFSAEASISWTAFSGTEFTGKSKCFHSSFNSQPHATAPNEGEVQFDYSKVPYRQQVFLVGSIKRGCFERNETEGLPVLELHFGGEDEEVEQHSLFFISFIIGLILLVTVILLGIAMITYYYVVTKSRQRRAEREARAMRS